MLALLRRPLGPYRLAGLVTAAILLNAVYCLTYTTLAGNPSTIANALAWGTINIAPWIVAVELAKGLPRIALVGALVAVAFAVSLGLGVVLAGPGFDLSFEAVRRVPGLLAASTALALLRSRIGRAPAEMAEMPLLPRQIHWVQAAGNYVELKTDGRTVTQRRSISAAERELADHGFVRIHRSTLVRRDRIARIRTEDVILADGTHLKIGKRYRAGLGG